MGDVTRHLAAASAAAFSAVAVAPLSVATLSVATLSVAVLAVSPLAPVATAQPELPGPPGYIPTAPDAEPGSFSYPYNVIVVGPPPATDSRGTRVSAGVDQGAKSAGLPGSSLGNSQQAGGSLVSSNTRFGITGGLEPPGAGNPGIDVRGGVAATPSSEDAAGRPAQDAVPIESVQPDELATPGGYPAPILETPGTVREGPAGVYGPTPQ